MSRSTTPVLVLNWNGWKDTLVCLESLRSADDVEDVWLVDNGSVDDRSEEAKRAYQGLRVLRWDDNYGFAGGYNRAMRIAIEEGHQFVYLLNNDATVTAGFLASALSCAQQNSSLAAVGSRVLKECVPSLNEHLSKQQPAVVGAGMLIRLSAVQEHGFFDERLFCYGEEVEWCLRLREHGHASLVCDQSVIMHRGEGSDRNGDATYYRVRNRFIVAETRLGLLNREPWREPRYYAAVTAESARREGDWVRWIAVAAGVEDALRNRSGKRVEAPVSLTAIARLLWWSFVAAVSDRLGRRDSQFSA
jgi:GT2 family glycosyltransferase